MLLPWHFPGCHFPFTANSKCCCPVINKIQETRPHHPTPASLRWLPVHFFRINFKILLIVYKSHHGLGPTYISELLTPHSTTRPLRSTHCGMLAVVREEKKTGRGQSFFCRGSSALEYPARGL
ncbi:hypothetical protein LDENG_00257020 [Lucifuga dentata]|nr:hypothetical protein LDENG_00257020 [Lucifuga dentata]